MKIGFTGTQQGLTEVQFIDLTALLWTTPDVQEFHHGDCIGADMTAHAVAKRLGLFVVTHPPTEPKKRAFCRGDKEWPLKDYLIRNREIVGAVDKMVACPQGAEVLQSGTWATIRHCRLMKKPLIIIMPTGQWTGSW